MIVGDSLGSDTPRVERDCIAGAAIGLARDPHSFPPQQSLLTRLLARLLPRLNAGHVTIETPSGERLDIAVPNPGPHATIVLHRWRCLWRCVTGGELGFAEGYMAGDWSSPNITAVLDLGIANWQSLQRVCAPAAPLRVWNRLMHRRRDNTKRGAKRNILAHYDLGNEFYARWLDREMIYSSALYSHPEQSLEEAQSAKIDRAIALLELNGGERVLEIGCGWGGLAERLIARHGCAVTGLTLSEEQLAYAQERLRQRGLLPQADVRVQDYRDVNSRFDRIVSIEMFEAVGVKYWPVFFDKLRECLKSGGVAVLQVITIDESRFDAYRKTPDFIQRYIFPGGMLPTTAIMRREIDRAKLALNSIETFGHSYAHTLAAWQQRFQAAWPDIQKLGFDLRFKRMWEYYLAYCEVGFRRGAIDVAHYQIRQS